MTEAFIDPIVVRETRNRLFSSMKDMEAGTGAADALLWFSARIKAHAKPADMFSLTAAAHSANGTEKEAERLLQAAAQHFHKAILEKAIEIAQAQLKSAEKSRKEMSR